MVLSMRIVLPAASLFCLVSLAPDVSFAQPKIRDHRDKPTTTWLPPGSPRPTQPITVCLPSLFGPPVCYTIGEEARVAPTTKGKPPTAGILGGDAGFARQAPSATGTGKPSKPNVIY